MSGSRVQRNGGSVKKVARFSIMRAVASALLERCGRASVRATCRDVYIDQGCFRCRRMRWFRQTARGPGISFVVSSDSMIARRLDRMGSVGYPPATVSVFQHHHLHRHPARAGSALVVLMD